MMVIIIFFGNQSPNTFIHKLACVISLSTISGIGWRGSPKKTRKTRKGNNIPAALAYPWQGIENIKTKDRRKDKGRNNLKEEDEYYPHRPGLIIWDYIMSVFLFHLHSPFYLWVLVGERKEHKRNQIKITKTKTQDKI